MYMLQCMIGGSPFVLLLVIACFGTKQKAIQMNNDDNDCVRVKVVVVEIVAGDVLWDV